MLGQQLVFIDVQHEFVLPEVGAWPYHCGDFIDTTGDLRKTEKFCALDGVEQDLRHVSALFAIERLRLWEIPI